MIKRLLAGVMLFMLQIQIYADDIHMPSSPKLHLQKSYQVKSEDIYSTDIFPQIDKRFKIDSIPINTFTLIIKSVDLKMMFARYGYEIVSSPGDYVEFRFIPDMREQDGLEFINKMYVRHYGKNLQIHKLLVRPIGKLPKDYSVIDFELSDSGVKKNSGTFSMKYRTPQSQYTKKLSFYYQIQATLQVVRSTQNIHSNENLSSQNVRADSINFERVGREFVSIDDIQNYSAKSYIRSEMIITKDKLKPRILIKKGDRIRVFNQQDGVSVEILLVAKQNGAYNEIINAQNPSSGKILRIRVKSEGAGEAI